MPKITTLKDELVLALSLLRKKGYFRAALRLEKKSLRILRPELFKHTKPKPRAAQLVGGSGKRYSIKIALDEDNE